MPELFTARILWVAFLVTQAVFVVVGTFFLPPPTGPAETTAVAVVMAMGLPPMVALSFGRRMFGHMPVLSAWLIKFALCEGVVLFGVVLHAIGAPTGAAWAMQAVGVVALLTQLPTAERFTRWEVDRLGRGQQ